MSLVLDGSATLAWLFPDETTDAIRAVFERVILEGAFVPGLWRIEVANSLTVRLADRHSLTVYDATYLELALRLSLPIATLDQQLREAAQREGLALLGQ